MLAGAVTKRRFRDCQLHVEFMTGWEPQSIPWRRADAGIYMLARYEVAIGDSFGFDFDLSGATSPHRGKLLDEQSTSSKFPVAKNNNAPRVCGSVFTYPSNVPNACLPPLVWQTLDIDFTAPRFDSEGKKTSKGVISARLNGHQTVDKQEINGPTPHGFKGPETPDGPFGLKPSDAACCTATSGLSNVVESCSREVVQSVRRRYFSTSVGSTDAEMHRCVGPMQSRNSAIIRHCTRTLQARGETDTSSCDRSF